ncbi:carotenoid biosynthesis protein [Dactylosporangium sp. NPDC005572]|uniref:carotenoid biosynthesis protein n=1 Tax=Dactylosporangium sp. NPDC005572 TaxID=3156889 RepID=UPI0033B1B60E
MTFLPLPLDGLLLTMLSLLAELVFAVVHGLLSYRWKGVVVFLVLALVVSNALENLSVRTGVPFGHYHYTDELGPKLFEVPVIIGPAYFAVGYLAWKVGAVLFDDVRRGSGWLTTIGTPLTASFVMVAWDLSMDPQSSTLRGRWTWEGGGGFFGVPITNFLGWSVTVYLFYQLFAIYQRRCGAQAILAEPLPRWYRLMPVIAYAVIALDYVGTYLAGGHDGVSSEVRDEVGHVWRAADIYESSALMAVYTMLFVAILASLKIAQDPHHSDRPQTSRDNGEGASIVETAEPSSVLRRVRARGDRAG